MILIKNVKELVQVEEGRLKVSGKEMARLPVLKNAWLLLAGDRILDFGSMEENYELRITNYELRKNNFSTREFVSSSAHPLTTIDATNRLVIPTPTLYTPAAARSNTLIRSKG